jgi:hypothetical protein
MNISKGFIQIIVLAMVLSPAFAPRYNPNKYKLIKSKKYERIVIPIIKYESDPVIIKRVHHLMANKIDACKKNAQLTILWNCLKNDAIVNICNTAGNDIAKKHNVEPYPRTHRHFGDKSNDCYNGDLGDWLGDPQKYPLKQCLADFTNSYNE